MGLSTFGTLPALVNILSMGLSLALSFDAFPLLLLFGLFYLFLDTLERKHHVPFWQEFGRRVSYVFGFETYLELAIAVSGQLIASS